ncbi:hypothetical protein LB505_011278 [Fusarium chuoi]|nr:hypothetical protein LB505_011278 [Fusarium chuoi]
MFEVQHNHHGQEFKRFFHHGRSSMSAIEDKRAEEFRRHVWAVTMIDEDPLAGSGEKNKNKKKNRQSIDLPSWFKQTEIQESFRICWITSSNKA